MKLAKVPTKMSGGLRNTNEQDDADERDDRQVRVKEHQRHERADPAAGQVAGQLAVKSAALARPLRLEVFVRIGEHRA
jgi:hypothetical protein